LEAFETFRRAWAEGTPYDLICMDIQMPKASGQDALGAIRKWEREHNVPLGRGAKVIMTTSMKDPQNILGAFNRGCEHYLIKPIALRRLLDTVRSLGLLAPQ
jgi:two-component system chemotaxis response regulator CheY